MPWSLSFTSKVCCKQKAGIISTSFVVNDVIEMGECEIRVSCSTKSYCTKCQVYSVLGIFFFLINHSLFRGNYILVFMNYEDQGHHVSDCFLWNGLICYRKCVYSPVRSELFWSSALLKISLWERPFVTFLCHLSLESPKRQHFVIYL